MTGHPNEDEAPSRRRPSGAVSGRAYKRTRPRGFAPWAPKAHTLQLIEQVQAVLDEYREHLPMTARQVFYRLVGAHDYPKTEQAYERLCEAVNRARRARIIPMHHIRDDRAESLGGPSGYDNPEHFWRAIKSSARYYKRVLTEGQPRTVEIWAEASGMLPMISNVANEYDVAVYSSGGFESVGAKHDAAQRIAYSPVPTTVLSIGDLDPSGLSMADAAAEDVAAFVAGMDAEPPTVTRLAVTPEQVREHRLITAPQKATDRRGAFMRETVQAEALSPDQLTAIVRNGIEAILDLQVLADVRRRSERERAELLDQVERRLS